MKLPAIQFYVGDWRKDSGVQALGFHDRGVWFEILCLMHESEQRGRLILNGAPMPEEALARILGLDKQILTTTLTTLLTYGVASKCEETGALISRRMVRDEEIRQIRKECGKLGGNPALLNQKPTPQVNQKSTPSSSSSSSISSSPSGGNIAHAPALTDEMPKEAAADFERIIAKINGLHPAWTRRPHFTRTQMEELRSNARFIFDLTDADWDLVTKFMDYPIPDDWGKFWQPDNRGKFITEISDIMGHADRWAKECRKRGVKIDPTK